jgi:hypothetical protein
LHPRLLTNHWPVLVVEWPATIELADVDTHFDEVGSVLDVRSGPFAFVVDVSRASPPAATVRVRAGERLRIISARYGSRLMGVAYVAPSALARGALTAVHWVARVEFPTAAFGSREEAVGWASERATPPPTSRRPGSS